MSICTIHYTPVYDGDTSTCGFCKHPHPPLFLRHTWASCHLISEYESVIHPEVPGSDGWLLLQLSEGAGGAAHTALEQPLLSAAVIGCLRDLQGQMWMDEKRMSQER